MKSQILSPRELATVLAALRYWQNDLGSATDDPIEEFTGQHFADQSPLTAPEIDTLCDRLNAPDTERRPPSGKMPAHDDIEADQCDGCHEWVYADNRREFSPLPGTSDGILLCGRCEAAFLRDTERAVAEILKEDELTVDVFEAMADWMVKERLSMNGGDR